MNTIFRYITNYKFYTIGAMILANVGMHIFKLEIYRMLTEFINTITTFVKPDSMLVMTFMKLLVIHLSQGVIKYLLEKIITLGIRDLFRNIIKCVMHNTMDFFKKDTQNKINQIWAYLTNIEIMMEKLLIELPSIMTFMIYYIYIIYSIYPQAILFILPINLFVLFALHPFSRKQYKLQKEKMYLDLDIKNKLLEATSNIEFVKLNNRENHEINRMDGAFSQYTLNKIKDKWITNCIELIASIFNDFLILVIYSIGIIFVLKNMFKPVDLIYLAINTGNFCYQIIQLKEIYNYYMKINPKVEIIYHMLNRNEQLCLNDSNDKKYHQIDNHSGNIMFENITFSYDGAVNVIKDLNFEFKDNKINLLLGPNGSGKSTLIKLLLRLYELDNKETQNNIYINGINVNDISLKDLRRKITFVSQEPHIFNETIMYNIKYGNENVPDNMIVDLCDILYSREWLLQNKNNLAGFRGRNLSGGERKKIQLINAICRNSDVIIFDEPTNTLDSNALQWFNEFIINLKDNHHKTIVIITHDIRLKTVADHIIDLTQQN